MKTRSRRGGFSLIELLTVIAIIAILAAIIFPVMSAVKNKAQQNSCLTNLHQVYLALDLYKRDNRKYPKQLVPVMVGKPMEDAKGAGLYAEHVSSIKVLHCPTSKITNTGEVAEYPSLPYDTASEPYYSYAYNSYDCYVKGIPVTGLFTGPDKVFRQYAVDWAPDVAHLQTSGAPLPDGAPAGDVAAAQKDYERQLKFRNPPGDTVVTWCMWHAGEDYSGRAQVVFADGSTGSYDAAIVRDCKWRIKPKKE